MISSTLRQKFIYEVPMDNFEMPLVIDDPVPEDNSCHFTLEKLHELELNQFMSVVKSLYERGCTNILLDVEQTKSKNTIIDKAIRCYLMSFQYKFHKLGFRAALFNKCV